MPFRNASCTTSSASFAVLSDVVRDSKDVPVIAADQLLERADIACLGGPYKRQLFGSRRDQLLRIG